jgi:hypothetical protein
VEYNYWLVYIGIALLTYTLTVEPTMSFGIAEYIATAKIRSRSPSGAPLYQMIGAFLPCLLPTIQNCLNGQYDVSLFSAFTILFLFWSSSIILRKLVSRFSELNKNNDVVILGSSFVGH